MRGAHRRGSHDAEAAERARLEAGEPALEGRRRRRAAQREGQLGLRREREVQTDLGLRTPRTARTAQALGAAQVRGLRVASFASFAYRDDHDVGPARGGHCVSRWWWWECSNGESSRDGVARHAELGLLDRLVETCEAVRAEARERARQKTAEIGGGGQAIPVCSFWTTAYMLISWAIAWRTARRGRSPRWICGAKQTCERQASVCVCVWATALNVSGFKRARRSGSRTAASNNTQ